MNTEPQTALAVVNPITNNHHTIAQEFLERVTKMITEQRLTIKKYAVEDDWRVTESVELKVDEKQVLQIQLVNTK
jgi:hypothetical protein